MNASRPFSYGELVKICMMMTEEVVCPEKQSDLANISLFRSTIADRIEDLSRNMDGQILDNIKLFIAFSAANNESYDVTDTAQLCVFIRGVDEPLTVIEEFLELIPMYDTITACDIFCSLVTALDKAGVEWSRVSLSVWPLMAPT